MSCLGHVKNSRLPLFGEITSLGDAVARIFAASSINELVGMMQNVKHPNLRSAYNILYLKDQNWKGSDDAEDAYHEYLPDLKGEISTKLTIEFRQHEAVVPNDECIERIVAWQSVTEGIVRFARDKPKDFVENYLMSAADRVEDVSLLEILSLLGLKAEAEFYRMRVLRNS